MKSLRSPILALGASGLAKMKRERLFGTANPLRKGMRLRNSIWG